MPSSCWPSIEAKLKCCADVPAIECWEEGRTFDACCDSPTESDALRISIVVAVLVAVTGFLAFYARSARQQQLKKSSQYDARRRNRCETMQHGLDTGQAEMPCKTQATENIPRKRCQEASQQVLSEGSEGIGMCSSRQPSALHRSTAESNVEATESSASSHDALHRLKTESNLEAADTATHDSAVTTHRATAATTADTDSSFWLLECGEGVLIESLGALDGTSLACLERTGRWLRHLQTPSLAGIWRFVHVRCLGGSPPQSVARAPVIQSSNGRPGGAWKEWWLWRRRLLAESDWNLSEHGTELASKLLEMEASIGDARVHPLKPSVCFVGNLIYRLSETFALDFNSSADRRLAHLSERWHPHFLTGADAALTDQHGFDIDQIQVFLSGSMCFSAMSGQPRFFLSWARRSAASENWHIDLVHCKVPASASASWVVMAREITSKLASGLHLSSSLCGAKWFGRFSFLVPEWQLRRCEVGGISEIAAIQKELFGQKAPATNDGKDGLLNTMRWILAATCPNPFSQDTGALATASDQILAKIAEQGL